MLGPRAPGAGLAEEPGVELAPESALLALRGGGVASGGGEEIRRRPSAASFAVRLAAHHGAAALDLVETLTGRLHKACDQYRADNNVVSISRKTTDPR